MFSSAEDAVNHCLIYGTHVFFACFVRTFLRDVHLICLNQHRSALYHTGNHHEICSMVKNTAAFNIRLSQILYKRFAFWH